MLERGGTFGALEEVVRLLGELPLVEILWDSELILSRGLEKEEL
jgi:hypothetical protein